MEAPRVFLALLTFGCNIIGSLAGQCCIAYTDYLNENHPQLYCPEYCCELDDYLYCCPYSSTMAKTHLVRDECTMSTSWMQKNFWLLISCLLFLTVIVLAAITFLCIRRQSKHSKRTGRSRHRHRLRNISSLNWILPRNVPSPPEYVADPPSYSVATASEDESPQSNPPAYEAIPEHLSSVYHY